MIRPRNLALALRRWRADEEGSIAVETLMMVPILVWAFLATLVYFDAYRAEAINEKANLTIADMFSRETGYVTPSYMEGAKDLMGFLTLHDDSPELRVTVFKWHQHSASATGHYHRVWSKVEGSNTRPELTTADVRGMANRLPVMSDGEQAILVETWVDYSPPYNPSWTPALSNDVEMDTFTVISPRFTSRLCWNETPNSGAATEVC